MYASSVKLRVNNNEFCLNKKNSLIVGNIVLRKRRLINPALHCSLLFSVPHMFHSAVCVVYLARGIGVVHLIKGGTGGFAISGTAASSCCTGSSSSLSTRSRFVPTGSCSLDPVFSGLSSDIIHGLSLSK